MDRGKAETALAADLTPIFDAQRAAFARDPEGTSWDGFQMLVQDTINERMEETAIEAALILLLILMQSDNSRAMADLIRMSMGSQLVINSARATAKSLVANTQRRALQAAIKLRAAQELIPEKLDTALRPVLGQTKAQEIAVTQTTRAISTGEDLARRIAQQSEGVDSVAVWITVRDDRVCPICRPLHGKTEAVWGGFFPNGPPAHPRCRCVKQYRLRRADGSEETVDPSED